MKYKGCLHQAICYAVSYLSFLLSRLYQINVLSVNGDVPTTFVTREHYNVKYFEKGRLNNEDGKQHMSSEFLRVFIF